MRVCKLCGKPVKHKQQTGKELLKIKRYPKHCTKCSLKIKKERINKQTVVYLSRLYGMTVEEYLELFNKANHVCQLCGQKERNGRRLSIDHCHMSGTVRGVLCNRCNTVLGTLETLLEQDLLIKSLDYLETSYTSIIKQLST